MSADRSSWLTGNSELISDGENRACHKGERFMVMHGRYLIAFVAPDRRSMEFDAKEKRSLWTLLKGKNYLANPERIL